MFDYSENAFEKLCGLDYKQVGRIRGFSHRGECPGSGSISRRPPHFGKWLQVTIDTYFIASQEFRNSLTQFSWIMEYVGHQFFVRYIDY